MTVNLINFSNPRVEPMGLSPEEMLQVDGTEEPGRQSNAVGRKSMKGRRVSELSNILSKKMTPSQGGGSMSLRSRPTLGDGSDSDVASPRDTISSREDSDAEVVTTACFLRHHLTYLCCAGYWSSAILSVTGITFRRAQGNKVIISINFLSHAL